MVEKIENFIAKGQTQKAIEALVEFTKENNSPLHDEAVLLSGQFRQWKRENTLGIQQTNSELRRIEVGIMDLLKSQDSIDKGLGTPYDIPQKASNTSSLMPQNKMPLVVGIIGGLALLMLAWYLMNESNSNEQAVNETSISQPVSETNKDTKYTESLDVFDSNAYYRLTNQWLGEGKSLDIINDGKNNQPILAKTSNSAGQFWKITKVGADIYTLTTKWQGPAKKLNCIQGPNQNRPVLNETEYSGSAWKIIPVGNEFYRITNMWLDDHSLDIINDGENNKIKVAKTGDYDGQLWKITKI